MYMDNMNSHICTAEKSGTEPTPSKDLPPSPIKSAVDPQTNCSSARPETKQYLHPVVHIPFARRTNPKRSCVGKRPAYFDEDDDGAKEQSEAKSRRNRRRFRSSSTSAFVKNKGSLVGKKKRQRGKPGDMLEVHRQENSTSQHQLGRESHINSDKVISRPIQNDPKVSRVFQVSPIHNRLVDITMRNKAYDYTRRLVRSDTSDCVCFQFKDSNDGFWTFEDVSRARKSSMLMENNRPKEVTVEQLLRLDLPHPTDEWYAGGNLESSGNNTANNVAMSSTFVDTKVAMKSLISDNIASFDGHHILP